MRTPLAKAFKGSFKDTELDYIIYVLLKELIAKSKIDPALIEDVCLGNVRHSSLSLNFHSIINPSTA